MPPLGVRWESFPDDRRAGHIPFSATGSISARSASGSFTVSVFTKTWYYHLCRSAMRNGISSEYQVSEQISGRESIRLDAPRAATGTAATGSMRWPSPVPEFQTYKDSSLSGIPSLRNPRNPSGGWFLELETSGEAAKRFSPQGHRRGAGSNIRFVSPLPFLRS
jgi:hypothetical protein